jgi:hypothetical protein
VVPFWRGSYRGCSPSALLQSSRGGPSLRPRTGPKERLIASAARFTVGQVVWRIGVKPQDYRELEAGKRSPDFETWDRICKLYGWPQTFVGK